MNSWTVFIPDWRPSTLNALLNAGKGRQRLKKADREVVAAAVKKAGVPMATQTRSVQAVIYLAKGQREADPDAYDKSLLDALVCCGALLDDGRGWVETIRPEHVRDSRRHPGTEVYLEDVPEPKRVLTPLGIAQRRAQLWCYPFEKSDSPGIVQTGRAHALAELAKGEDGIYWRACVVRLEKWMQRKEKRDAKHKARLAEPEPVPPLADESGGRASEGRPRRAHAKARRRGAGPGVE